MAVTADHRRTTTRDCGCRFLCIAKHLSQHECADLNPPLPGEQVYFIGAADGPVKIGRSTDVQGRLCSMQTGSPVKLEILAVVFGGRDLERLYHAHFSEQRLHGEWFTPTEAMRQEIRRHAW